MSKKSFSREVDEKKEGLEEIKNDVPENRLQKDQQVQNVDDAIKTDGPEVGWKKKKAEGKGSELKQQQISDAITGSASGAGMGITAAGRRVSGTVGGVLGASNSTPSAGKSRGNGRVDKKLDRTATKLNYTPCEQVIVAIDESKPLADASGEDQGYNGTYRNEDARSQKIMGAVPGDLMYQRSVDYIFKDKAYFVEGQMDYQNNNASTTDPNPKVSVDPETGEEHTVAYHSGNFIHKAAHFIFNDEGKVSGVYFDVDNIDPLTLTPDDANMTSAHRLIKENTAELNRITMDAKAGDEKAEIWTPMARAIQDPTATSYLMSSIEADTGAFVHLAYSKATTCMSHQLNRGAKDGLDVVTPAIENVVGWRSTDNTNIDIYNEYHGSLDEVFSTENYRAADPSIMIAAYDSTGKYKNKADLLLQPRGYRMHLQTADNNMNSFKVPAEYANVYSGQEVYSTIDHEYDPILPICITDKATLVTVHNFNELGGFFHNHYKLSITSTSISGSYTGRNQVILTAKQLAALGYTNAYVYVKRTSESGDGLAYNGSTNVISYEGDSANHTATYDLIIKTIQLTEEQLDEDGEYYGYSLVATYTTAATHDLTFKIPNITANITATYFRDDYERTYANGSGLFAYSYHDLRNNYIVDVKHPLIEGLVQYFDSSIGGKVKSLINQDEFNLPLIFSTQYMTTAQLMICAATPWITRVRINSMKDVIYYEDNIHEYPYNKLISLKDAPFKHYVNFDFTNYDEPINTKVMIPTVAIQWTMPEFFWKIDTEQYVLPWYFNEVDLNSDGTVDQDAANMSMPSIRSGIRLGALDDMYGLSEKDIRLSLDRMARPFLSLSKFATKGAYKYGRTTDGQVFVILSSGALITVSDILSAPRELGLCMDLPLGYLTKDPLDLGAYKALNADGTATSFRIKVYVNPETPIHPEILANSGVNIRRAANYTQKWYELTANNATTNTDLCGLVFGMNDEPSQGLVKPFAELGTSGVLSNASQIYTLQRSLYTRLQFLPFVISPFDGVSNGRNSNDIYDFAYVFGLAGFRASDYRESVYNREKEVINQGILFVEDPWIIDSPIVKYAGKDKGVSITKGYEI